MFGFFKRKQNSGNPLQNYLKYVFKSAEIEPVNLFLIGQYNFESVEQADAILNMISLKDYSPCQGFHNSQLTNDIIFIYLAVGENVCKILVVFDPVELFDSPRLLGSFPVQDCDEMFKYTVQKEF